MQENVITIETLVHKIRSKTFNSNEYIFFQELVKEICDLTKNKLIYCNGFVFFGKKRCVINNMVLIIHFCDGKFSHLEQIEPDGSSQTFRKDTLSSLR